MNRKLALTLTSLAVLLFVSLSLLAQGGPGSRNGMPANGQCAACAATSTATQPLTPEEIRWLLFLREEENLVRDVYVVLYDTWKLNIFSNISWSE